MEPGADDERLLFFPPDQVADWEAGLADFFDLRDPSGWTALQEKYEKGRSERTHKLLPWRRCLQVASQNLAASAVVERRYVCYDYQSEYATFYSHVHASIPRTTHRIHFFGKAVGKADFRRLTPEQVDSYLGYIVCRPRDLEIVGRTMLKPPPDRVVLTCVKDPVTFFGQPLSVSAFPFMQQDERLGVCANVAAWIVHYTAYRNGYLNRKLIAEFLQSNNDFLRPKNNSGLQAKDLVELLNSVGFRTEGFSREPYGYIPLVPSLWHKVVRTSTHDKKLIAAYKADQPITLEAMDPDQRVSLRNKIIQKCSRHLNSGLPVIANSFDHTVVVCGYQRIKGDRLAELVVQDDQAGPYILVQDCLFDRIDIRDSQAPNHVPHAAANPPAVGKRLMRPNTVTGGSPDWFEWLDIVTPLPPSVFLPLHRAEKAAVRLLGANLRDAEKNLDDSGAPPAETTALLEAAATDSLRLSTYVCPANIYKARLEDRGASLTLSEEYRSLRCAEFVVVVEFIALGASILEGRCLGEVVFDATSNPKNPWVHALRLGTAVSLVHSDATWRTISAETGSLTPGATPYAEALRVADREATG